MPDLRLKLACWDYDRSRPLMDGRVRPAGIDLDIKVLRPRETFPRMLDKQEFHVSEMSLASYVSHKGKPVGPTQFGSTGLVFMKGMLAHDYGVKPADIHWFIGGLDAPTQRPL